MAFPTVRTRTESAPASSTSLTINFDQQTGDLVVIFLAFDGTARTLSTVGDGFTNLTNTSATFHILYKVLDGSEGGNVVVTIAVASKAAAIAYNITSGTHASATAPVFSTVATGTSTGPDPGSLSPAGGSKDYLWIAAFRQNGEEADDDTWCNNGPTTPGTFTDLVQKTTGISGATTTNGSVASAEYTAATATVDPGAFNTDQSLAWRAYTLAIYPDQSPKTISPSSISSAEAFGTAIVKFPQTVSLSSISSAEVFGSLTVTVSLTISPPAISPFLQYAQEVIADSPVSYWRLGESSGNPQDSVGSNHVYTINGSPTYGEIGALSSDSNKAILLDGSTQDLRVADHSSLDLGDGPLTLELWIKRSRTGVGEEILLCKFSGGYAVSLSSITTDRIAIAKSNVAILVESTKGVTDQAWHHIVVMKSGSYSAIFLDGEDVTGTITNYELADNNNDLMFGTENGFNRFGGTLDEVALYSHLLTPERILDHYRAGTEYRAAILADSPVSYWRLGEASGTVAVDQKAANTGTYVGGYSQGALGSLVGDGDTAATLDGQNGSYVLAKAGGILGGMTNFSVEAWVKVNGDSGFDKAIYCERGSSGNDILKLQVVTGSTPICTVQFVYRNDAGTLVFDPTSSVGIGDNEWHHVVITKNGTTGWIYVDGGDAQTASITPSDTFTDTLSSRIGGDAQDANAYFLGSLDEVAVYNYALTPAQVVKHFEIGRIPRGVSPLLDFINPLIIAPSSIKSAEVVNSAYSSVILRDIPIAYWRLGEASGNPQDSSGNGHHVTSIGGSPDYAQSGAIAGDANTAIGFVDSSSEYLSIPYASPLGLGNGPFTLEAWVKPVAAYDAYATIVAMFGSYMMRLASGGSTWGLELVHSQAQIIVTSTTTLSAGQYHHVVATKTGSTSKLYVDGVDVTGAVTDSTIDNPATAVFIGTEASAGGYGSATIDEVAVYGSVLTPAQVTEHYLAGISRIVVSGITIFPSSIKSEEVVNSAYSSVILRDTPIAYWRLGETSGTNANDEVGTADGTYENTPTLNVAGALTGDSNTAITLTRAAAEGVNVGDPGTTFDLGDTLSIECWVKRRAGFTTAAYHYMVSKGDQGGLSFDQDDLVLWDNDGSQCSVSSIAITDSNWHHIVATHSDGADRIYIDGVDRTVPGTQAGRNVNADPLYLGRYWNAGLDGQGDTLDGSLDEVAIYNYVLTPKQVTEHYLAGIGGIVVSGGGATSNVIYPSAISSGETFGTATILRGTVSVLPSSINSAEASGTAVLKPTSILTPTAIGTTETFGTPVIVRGGVTISVTTITSAEALGTSTILKGGVQIQVTGIGSQETPGNVTLIKIAVIIPTAISSSETFGTASVDRGEARVIVFGIASSEVIPSPVVKTTNLLSITGITTGEVSGTSTIIRGIAFIVVSGIVSTETVGTPLLPAGLLFFLPGEIVSSETFGVPLLRPGSVQILVSGIGSGQALGSPVLSATARIVPSAITSGETVSTGTSLVAGGVTIQVSSIISGESFGNPTLITGAGLIVPIAITTGEAFGSQTVLRGGVTIIVSAVGTGEALGSPIIRSAASIIVSSVTSLQAFGTPTLLPSSIIQVGSIGSAEAFGNPVIPAPLSAILVAGIGSAEAFGTHLVLTGGMAVQPVGIPTAQALGLPTLTGTAWVLPEGIAPAEALGWPVLVPGMVWIYPGGIPSLAQVGTPAWLNALISRKWVNPSPVYANTKPGGFPEIQTDYGHTQRDEGED